MAVARAMTKRAYGGRGDPALQENRCRSEAVHGAVNVVLNSECTASAADPVGDETPTLRPGQDCFGRIAVPRGVV